MSQWRWSLVCINRELGIDAHDPDVILKHVNQGAVVVKSGLRNINYAMNAYQANQLTFSQRLVQYLVQSFEESYSTTLETAHTRKS